LGLMAMYKIGTSSYAQDTDKLPLIFLKKKIAILPSWSANRKIVKRIFKKASQDKEG
ncbi:MAG: hypothetical protein GXP53_08710, partial [Deltaproteobacteria bacterium]|nr:hypothetical protein [Deltaproteobacteria bacterium]